MLKNKKPDSLNTFYIIPVINLYLYLIKSLTLKYKNEKIIIWNCHSL